MKRSTESNLVRIATFNLLNSIDTWPQRLEAICEELARVDADVVALQEVPTRVAQWDARDAAAYLAERLAYPHVAFRAYPDDSEEGLAFLSKYPLISAECGWNTDFSALGSCGLRVQVLVGKMLMAITNVHLDWQSIATREAQIIGITEWISARADPTSHELLCGDFNCRPESSVYRFLMGQQTLDGRETAPWHDLAACHACRTGEPLLPTLDFATNPRWKNAPTLALPARVDWILLQDRWPASLLDLREAYLFGVEPTPTIGVVPSDHYGVWADLD